LLQNRKATRVTYDAWFGLFPLVAKLKTNRTAQITIIPSKK